MDAVVGGPVVCFALRVVGALQYLCSRGRRISSSVFYSSWGVVVSRRSNFSQSRQFVAQVCVAEKRYGGHKCAGTPAKFALVWAGLNAKCPTLSAKFLTPWGGWGKRDLSVDTEPDRSDGARIKLHYGAMKGAS